MATITIKSNKTDDLYFISELARRLGLPTEVETDDKPIENSKRTHITEDEKLIQMGISSSGAALKDFLINETEKMF
jgi:hypothetical protein